MKTARLTTHALLAGLLFTATQALSASNPGDAVIDTVSSASGRLKLGLDAAGVIRDIAVGGKAGGPPFQRAVLGHTILANTNVKSVCKEAVPDGFRFVRRIQSAQGHEATVTETFKSGAEADSLSWDVIIESADKAWTTSIQTFFQMTPVDDDLRLWSAWSRPDLPTFNGYGNPLVPMPFKKIQLAYGGGSSSKAVAEGFSVPIASWLHASSDHGLSLVESPFDFIQDMMLHSNAQGAVNFERTKLRIGGGNTIRLHLQLVAHAEDWRAGLGFMTRVYAGAFDPPSPAAHAVGGGGTYADYRGEALDADKLKAMGFSFNWSARFPWPYIGMSLPPVATDDENWMSIGGKEGSGNVLVSSPESVNSLNKYADALRRQGFHQLEYFTVTEAGNYVAKKAPPRKAVNDADLWKDPNDFIYYRIPEANLGHKSWLDCCAVDPGDPAWQAEIIRQVKDICTKLSCSGICIDRLDHLARFNPSADDGTTWTGSPARSLIYSWHQVMDRLIPIASARKKVVFGNSHIMRRVDVLRHLDGFYSEFRHASIHNLLAFAGVRKPVVIWNSPTDDPSFQESLYLGIFPSVPFPKANHNTQPDVALEKLFLDYGAMFNAMRGRKWVLRPHVVSVTGGNALANLFEVPSGFVIPVMFGGKATSATVELGPLPVKALQGAEVLHPGADAAAPVKVQWRGDRAVLEVQLVRGCALVRLLADQVGERSPAR